MSPSPTPGEAARLEPGLLRAVELLRDREAQTHGGPRLAEIRGCIAILNEARRALGTPKGGTP